MSVIVEVSKGSIVLSSMYQILDQDNVQGFDVDAHSKYYDINGGTVFDGSDDYIYEVILSSCEGTLMG